MRKAHEIDSGFKQSGKLNLVADERIWRRSNEIRVCPAFIGGSQNRFFFAALLFVHYPYFFQIIGKKTCLESNSFFILGLN